MENPKEATPTESLTYILNHGTLEEAFESWEEILRLVLTVEGDVNIQRDREMLYDVKFDYQNFN